MRVRSYLVIVACGAVTTLFAIAALYRFGEPFDATTLPERLADIQAARPDTVVLPFDLRYNLAFKIRRLETERPEIAWFATSRAGSATAEMFKPYSFYNMGFTGWTTEQLEYAFERSTRRVRPRLVILSLDFFLFSDRWEEKLRMPRQMILNEPLRYLQSSLGYFVRSALTRWPEFQAYAQAPSRFVGPATILEQEGFRHDGSWLFTKDHIESARLQYRNVGFLVDSLLGGPEMSARRKAAIERIADIAKARGIKLVAVQLPYLRAGVEFLDHRDPQDRYHETYYGVWRDFESGSTASWLHGLGIELLDLAHSSIDDDADNFIDAYHPSEEGMGRAVRELMNAPGFQSAIAGPPTAR